MSPTSHFGSFQPITSEAVKTGMPVGEALAVALAQNTAWLYETISGEAASPLSGRTAPHPHDHDGANSAFLQQVQMVFRGMVRGCTSLSALQGGVNCGPDERKPLPFLLPALVSGDPCARADGITTQSRAYNWLPHYAIAITPGPYMRFVRMRVQAGNKIGSRKAYLLLAARQPSVPLTVTKTGAGGIGGFREWESCVAQREINAGEGNVETVELCLDLRPDTPTEVERNFRFDPAQPMYLSLWSQCDPGVSMIVGDSLSLPHTGPCLAITTR